MILRKNMVTYLSLITLGWFCATNAKIYTVNNDEDITKSYELNYKVNNDEDLSESCRVKPYELNRAEGKKNWTFLTYMAADNDLYPFADRNIEQMCNIGSNDKVNILVHLDIRKSSNVQLNSTKKKVTKRLLINKKKIQQLGQDSCMDSGRAETLIDAARWAITDFPSDYLAISLWNHGCGAINPSGRIINPVELFYYDPATSMIKLDRSIAFLEYATQQNEKCHRGVCFDETTGNYLNDERLEQALKEIVRLRGGKKIDLIIFDACLMASIETCKIIAPYANYMTASEEVELGTGYPYNAILKPLAQGPITPVDFTHHIVATYNTFYHQITQDYTHSSFDLGKSSSMFTSVQNLAKELTQAIADAQYFEIYQAINTARRPYSCTHFEEPSYIDLAHFCSNLLISLEEIKTSHAQNSSLFKMAFALQSRCHECLDAVKNLVLSNATGDNLSRAQGISIYFPLKGMHPSYPYTSFGKDNAWLGFLNAYLTI